jgi:hypothetical protein
MFLAAATVGGFPAESEVEEAFTSFAYASCRSARRVIAFSVSFVLANLVAWLLSDPLGEGWNPLARWCCVDAVSPEVCLSCRPGCCSAGWRGERGGAPIAGEQLPKRQATLQSLPVTPSACCTIGLLGLWTDGAERPPESS